MVLRGPDSTRRKKPPQGGATERRAGDECVRQKRCETFFAGIALAGRFRFRGEICGILVHGNPLARESFTDLLPARPQLFTQAE